MDLAKIHSVHGIPAHLDELHMEEAWWYSRGVRIARGQEVNRPAMNSTAIWKDENNRLACIRGYKAEKLKLLLQK